MDPVEQNFQLCESTSCTDLPDLDIDVTYRGYHNFIEDKVTVEESDNESEINEVCNQNHNDNGKRKVLKPEMVNEGIKIMSYAVRGPLMLRANELQRQLEEVKSSLYTQDAKCLS